MMYRNLLFMCGLLLLSCSVRVVPEHIKVAEAITYNYCKHVQNTDGFEVTATGGGFLGNINHITIMFRSYKTLQIPEARQLIIEKMEEFLAVLNNNCEVRPYLNNYPATEKNFELTIGFMTLEGIRPHPPFVACVSVVRGIVGYSYNDFEKNDFKIVLTETYDEAYEIVYGQKKFFEEKSNVVY